MLSAEGEPQPSHCEAHPGYCAPHSLNAHPEPDYCDRLGMGDPPLSRKLAFLCLFLTLKSCNCSHYLHAEHIHISRYWDCQIASFFFLSFSCFYEVLAYFWLSCLRPVKQKSCINAQHACFPRPPHPSPECLCQLQNSPGSG